MLYWNNYQFSLREFAMRETIIHIYCLCTDSLHI